MMADRISHVVLLATSPPGPIVKAAEQLFYETAAHPVNTSEDEVILFFEPRDEASRIAARASAQRIASRQAGHSVAVPWEWAVKNLGSSPKNPAFPAAAVLDALRLTSIPVLHIAGDHDIVFPVENWYALNQRLPTLQLAGRRGMHCDVRANHILRFGTAVTPRLLCSRLRLRLRLRPSRRASRCLI
jgi:pimeloyl-ACP methyl ester carboxylesterase